MVMYIQHRVTTLCDKQTDLMFVVCFRCQSDVWLTMSTCTSLLLHAGCVLIAFVCVAYPQAQGKYWHINLIKKQTDIFIAVGPDHESIYVYFTMLCETVIFRKPKPCF